MLKPHGFVISSALLSLLFHDKATPSWKSRASGTEPKKAPHEITGNSVEVQEPTAVNLNTSYISGFEVCFHRPMCFHEIAETIVRIMLSASPNLLILICVNHKDLLVPGWTSTLLHQSLHKTPLWVRSRKSGIEKIRRKFFQRSQSSVVAGTRPRGREQTNLHYKIIRLIFQCLQKHNLLFTKW